MSLPLLSQHQPLFPSGSRRALQQQKAARIFFSLALAFYLSPPALAGQVIESSLELILRQAPPESVITVLVQPALEADISSVESDLLRGRAGRRERHRRIVQALKLRSEAAQAGLRDYLRTSQSAGRVSVYRPFWIANLIAVSAPAEEIRRIAARKDVAAVLEDRTVYLQADKRKKEPGAADATSVAGQPGLAANGKYFNWALDTLHVRQLWKKGYTGRGILVANIDSGVDGAHPALASKWRGVNGATVTESWFDPWKGGAFPLDDDPSIGPTHGTLSMGLMLGQSGADTIGAAPDAQWIAANAFEVDSGQITTSREKLLQCFQWVADPDGDETTVDDVPDILNNSWADQNTKCDKTYWNAIYNLMALGVTCIQASGNYPQHGTHVSSPGDNPDFFAVGSVNSSNLLSTFSLTGPSWCDPNKIKPDVVSPGEGYQSTSGSTAGSALYADARGTSFSTPLISGVAALLKQRNPELLPNQITGALRSSARDLGVSGPDNQYGWGLVNADSALKLLPAPVRPEFAITKIVADAGSDGFISPGETVSLSLTVINNGTSATAVSGSLLSNSADVTVPTSQTAFGDMLSGSVKTGSPALVLVFSSSIPLSVIRTFRLVFSSGMLRDTVSLALNVGGVPATPMDSAGRHNINRVGVALTNYGVIGDSAAGGWFIYPLGAQGAKNHLFQGSLLVATGAGQVSDVSYGGSPFISSAIVFDTDFTVIPGGNIELDNPGPLADQEITGAFNDSRAGSPLKVEIHQRSFAWSASEDDSYIIVEYSISGSADSNLGGVYAGQHLDWDVNDNSDNDEVAFESSRGLAYMYDTSNNAFVGHVLLTQAVTGFRALNFLDDIQDGFTGAEKFGAMTNAARDTIVAIPDDWSELLAAGPVTLLPGKKAVVAYALVAGPTVAELRKNAAQAKVRFTELATAQGIDLIPPWITFTPITAVDSGFRNYNFSAAAGDDTYLAELRLFWHEQGGSGAWSSAVAAQKPFSDSLTAQIPSLPAQAHIDYYWRAIDAQGNYGYLPQGAPAGEYFSLLVADKTAPVISKTAASPDTSGAGPGVLLSTEVVDNNLTRVFAVLQFGAGQADDTLDLLASGVHIFSGLVQGLPRGTQVAYFIVAADSSGNLTTDPQSAPLQTLSFEYLPIVPGDGDSNGKVNVFDLIALIRVLGGTLTPTWEQSFALDLRHNGKIDIFDLIELLKLLSANM